MDLFEIKIKNQLPFIHLNRELSEFDLAPIVERENSIMFILEDDPWQKETEGYSIKLRFRSASDLVEQINQLKKKDKIRLDQNHEVIISNICKVFKTYTINESSKDSIAVQLYNVSVKTLTNNIEEFNVHSLMRGMTRED